MIAEDGVEIELPPIRSFDIETLSLLGQQIYTEDRLAWIATDVLVAEKKMDSYVAAGARGWIVDTGVVASVVRFIVAKGDRFETIYDVEFADGMDPVLRSPEDPSLSEKQLASFHARETAVDAWIANQSVWCGGQANTVVLDDPDGSGYLVYFLRANPSADLIPIGGHYRVTVSADGKTAEQIDRLFVNCMEISKTGKEDKMPEGAKVVALTMSHVVSSTPIETHVFLSIQTGIPFYVTTVDSETEMWQIVDGFIHPFMNEKE